MLHQLGARLWSGLLLWLALSSARGGARSAPSPDIPGHPPGEGDGAQLWSSLVTVV